MKLNIKDHYDLPPALFEMFLDPSFRAYSAGRWSDDTRDLETAQRDNQMSIITALKIGKRSSVLDVGCGWGALIRACSQFRIRPALYVGLTPSRTQMRYVQRLTFRRSNTVYELHPVGWQNFAPARRFDAVVANEVIEHIAPPGSRQNGLAIDLYRQFFQFADHYSTSKAKLYVQTTVQLREPRSRRERDALWFILRRVFPGSITGDLESVLGASKGIYAPVETDLNSTDYILTLASWRARMEDARQKFIAKFGEDLFTFFDRYFSSCLYLFQTEVISLMRTTFEKPESIVARHHQSLPTSESGENRQRR